METANRSLLEPALPYASRRFRYCMITERAYGRKFKPSAVRVAPLLLRLKRITSNSFSSSLIALVRDGCEMYSRSAARLKEPVSAMAITSFSCCRVIRLPPSVIQPFAEISVSPIRKNGDNGSSRAAVHQLAHSRQRRTGGGPCKYAFP